MKIEWWCWRIYKLYACWEYILWGGCWGIKWLV